MSYMARALALVCLKGQRMLPSITADPAPVASPVAPVAPVARLEASAAWPVVRGRLAEAP
jgi:hypothetical protein